MGRLAEKSGVSEEERIGASDKSPLPITLVPFWNQSLQV